MAMLPGLRPLKETLTSGNYAALNGAYDIYVQDERNHAEARTYYLAKWIKLAAGTYTLKYMVDDAGTMSIDKVQQFAMAIGSAPQSHTFTINANGVYRLDMTHTEAPDNTPSYIAYQLLNAAGETIEVSRADAWIGDIVPIPDAALGPKPPYNDDVRLSYPIFLQEPDWTTPVLERMEWNTDVLTSESGAEQRRKLRHSPRYSVEAAFLAHGNKRALVDNYITGVGMSNGLVPLWWDKAGVTSKAVAGSVDLFADIANRSFNVNDVVIIRHYLGNVFDYELNIVAEVKAGQLVLAYGLQKDTVAGDSITPVRVARLLDMPNGTNLTDEVRQYSLRFSCNSPETHAAAWTNLPIYSRTNLPILTWTPNYRDTMSLGFERQNYMWDNEIGTVYNRDPGGQAFTNLQYTYHVHGRQQMKQFKDVLYALSGRWKEIHVLSGQNDVALSRDIDAAQGALVAHRSGYQQYGTVNQNVRRDILIELYDGRQLPNTIISSRVIGDEEWLFLSETVVAIPKEQVRRISYMSRARLDIDGIEITRLTDADGASQLPLTFRTMTERRVATPVNFT